MSLKMGLLGRKIGMTQVFHDDGSALGCTAVAVGPCVVVGKRTAEKHGYSAIQLGFEETPVRLLTRPQSGYFKKAGVEKPLRVLRELVADVLARTGIALSVGVAPNRLIAKICSDLGKPRGFVAMGREEAAQRFAGDSPSRLPGIGPKTAERLRAAGIETIGALQRLSEADLAARFGARHGRELHRRAWFHDDSPVETERVLKSRSNEVTFDEDVASPAELETVLRRLARELCEGLAARGKRGRTIGIKVRLDDWTNVTRARTIEAATCDVELVTEIAVELLRAYAPPRPVRLLGVRMASFAREGETAARRPAPAAAAGQLALPLG
jgi:DNA polymerase IV